MDENHDMYNRVLMTLAVISLVTMSVITAGQGIQSYERNATVYAADVRHAEAEALQDEQNAAYLEEREQHDAGYTDAGPVRAYPDGGMSPEDYMETCRILCVSHRDHIGIRPDAVGEGVPHVVSVNQAASSCVCWRPDEPWGNHIEVHYSWHRQLPGGG